MLKLTRFLERLPEEAAVIKLLIGDSRKQQTEAIFVIGGHQPRMKSGEIIPELIAFDAAEETILTEAENLGWGIDFTHMRLNVKDADMNHIKSLTLSQRLRESDLENGDQSQAIQHLTNGLLAMSREVRNTLAIVSDSLAHRESLYADVLGELLEAKRDVADAETQAMAMNLAMQAEDMKDTQGFQQEALSQLGGIVQMVMGGKTPTQFTTDQAMQVLKGWIKDQPDIIRQAMEDEEISRNIMQTIMKMQQEAPPE